MEQEKGECGSMGFLERFAETCSNFNCALQNIVQSIIGNKKVEQRHIEVCKEEANLEVSEQDKDVVAISGQNIRCIRSPQTFPFLIGDIRVPMIAETERFFTRLHRNGEMRIHSNEEIDNYYKHLKRIKNRQTLYEKRKRLGRV